MNFSLFSSKDDTGASKCNATIATCPTVASTNEGDEDGSIGEETVGTVGTTGTAGSTSRGDDDATKSPVRSFEEHY